MKPELEKLIDAVVRDGVVTEKDRNVVLRKASELGVDPDEAEIYLESKLEEAQEARSRNKVATPAPAASGPSNCKACGAAIQGHFVCEFCGTPTGASASNEAEEFSMISEVSKAAQVLASQRGSESDFDALIS